MAKVLNGVTDDRQTTDDRLQTDGLVIAHSEREFTFAKKTILKSQKNTWYALKTADPLTATSLGFVSRLSSIYRHSNAYNMGEPCTELGRETS